MVSLRKTAKSASVALAGGFVNGLLGSGGGTLLVPGMNRILGFETHKSHATAVSVILPLSIISAFIYSRGVSVDWAALACISAGGVVGGYVGAKLLNKLSDARLHKLFGTFMIAAAIRMIL